MSSVAVRPSLMGEDIEKTAKWVANVESGHAPRLACCAIFYCQPFCEQTFVSLVEIVHFNRQIRYRCARTLTMLI